MRAVAGGGGHVKRTTGTDGARRFGAGTACAAANGSGADASAMTSAS